MSYGLGSVTVQFGDVTALDDVSVEVAAGAVVAVVGGDGAGKTTLLRTLVREVIPDSGTVEAPGKADIGFLPASSGSWASLSVAENLDFAGGVFGLSGTALTARRDELLAGAGLTEASDRLASQLSGGMRRKLGFCMAIIHQPRLLVLDEPSTGVDPVSRIDLWRMTSEAAAAGTAVIMSTTYLDEAERAAQLVVLDAGVALLQGSYDEVRQQFPGTVTRVDAPTRPEWSWPRGRSRHAYWPDSDQPSDHTVLDPDLEDIVIASTLVRRATVGSTAGAASGPPSSAPRRSPASSARSRPSTT